MNANIGVGYGKILFGMKENEIIQVLGDPDKIIDAREDGIEYLYNSLKLKLFFGYEEDDRLYSIEVFDKDVTFLSYQIIGMPFEDFEKIMIAKGYNSCEHDDYAYFNTVYYEEINTTFTMEFDEIKSFEFSPLFEEDKDTIIWPVK